MTAGKREAERTALITGVSSGIGRELAAAFVEEGFAVAGCARTKSALTGLARRSAGGSGRLTTYVCDVTRTAQATRMVAAVLRRMGRIDVLVNNVGSYGPIGLALDLDVDAWWKTLKANLYSTFLLTRLVAPAMSRRGGGKIINFSGGGAATPFPRYSAYASSKAAICRFTETVAEELKAYNIQVNAVAPGFVPTRIHEATLAAGEQAGEFYSKTIDALEHTDRDAVIKRIRDLVLFLASPQANRVTGRVISAQWDDWVGLEKLLAAKPGSSVATLRRIDNFKFFEH